MKLIKIISLCTGFFISYFYVIHIIDPHADTMNQGDDSLYLVSVLYSIVTIILAGACGIFGLYRNTTKGMMVLTLLLMSCHLVMVRSMLLKGSRQCPIHGEVR